MKQDDMDKIYKEKPFKDIPWNFETPPAPLVDLVETGKIKPCKTIDLGCGIGNYVIYLASKGFNVTGIDLAPTAIDAAKRNAYDKGISCNFLVADVLGDLDNLPKDFDFAYDWELFHHIFPENRQKYINNIHRLLKPDGKYLSVCFNEKDPSFGGQGKIRRTPLGTTLYFSSINELKTLFESKFNIKEIKAIEIRGRPVSHIANYVFSERR